MTAVKRTDIVVVGGGAAGYISAIIAARNGAGDYNLSSFSMLLDIL